MNNANTEFFRMGPGAVTQLKAGPNAIKTDERGNAIILMRTYVKTIIDN